MTEWVVAGFIGLLFVRSCWLVGSWSTEQKRYPTVGINDITGDRLWSCLYKFFKQGMIRSPYGGRIIPPYIIPAQALRWPAHARGVLWLTAHVTGRQSYLPTTTVRRSYLLVGTVLISYLTLTTGLESYLPVRGVGQSTPAIVGFLLFPLLGLAHFENSSQETLGGFGGSNNDEHDRDEQTTTTENSTNSDNSEYTPAYGYSRQSQTDGKDRDDSGDTQSIKSQKENILEIGEQYGFGPVKMFSDLDESGFSFDREGLNKLRDHLEQDPRPILLDRVNRLGRDTLETIYVAAKLHYTYDIPIVTYRHGKYDLGSTDDQIMLVVEAISAGKSVEDRIRAAWDTIKRKFKEEGVWRSWFTNIRVGYKLPEDKTWPEPAPDGDVVVSAIMHDTIELGEYAKVARLLRRKSKNESLELGTQNELQIQTLDGSTIQSVFDYSDIDLDTIDGSKIKTIVSDPIYIGEVEYPRNAEPDQRAVIEDDDLQIVDVELFEDVVRVVERISGTNATTEESVDVRELADLGLLVKTTDEVDAFRPVCERCDRGMVKNGTDRLKDGRTAHYWICPTYRDGSSGSGERQNERHPQRKFPREGEWAALINHLETEHPNPSEIVVLRVCPFDS